MHYTNTSYKNVLLESSSHSSLKSLRIKLQQPKIILLNSFDIENI